MNMLTTEQLTMSSREIADITGKSHSNVMRDIRIMTDELKQNSNLNFVCESSTYISDSSGQSYPSYQLDRDTTECLLTGYSAVLRMKVIKRWKELEGFKPLLPQTFSEALQLAADQAQLIEEAKPKVEFHDTVTQSEHTYKYQEAGKKIQQRPNKFVAWLRENGYIDNQNNPYQRYIGQGLFKFHTGMNNETGHEFTQGRVTTKGLSYFTNKLSGTTL